MVVVWGEREVKVWAKEQRHVTPDEVRKYVAGWVAARNAA